MPIEIENLIVTQDTIPVGATFRQMIKFVRQNGYFTEEVLPSHFFESKRPKLSGDKPKLIGITRFEDGKLYLHDGHRRTCAIVLGSRNYLRDDEYFIKDMTYSLYSEINFDVGFVTPFDPRVEVRVNNFSRYKNTVMDLWQQGRIDEALAYIKEHKNWYARPREHTSVYEILRTKKFNSYKSMRAQMRDDIYGNYLMQDPNGKPLARTDTHRAKWYLSRGLAVEIEEKVIRLTFPPKGRKNADDPFALSVKQNICVICGTRFELSKHHIVPIAYRRHFPQFIKQHCFHDIVLTCVTCHLKYERKADILKKQISEEFGVPVHGILPIRDEAENIAIKSAFALFRHGDKLPAERKDKFINVLREYLKKDIISDEDIKLLTDKARSFSRSTSGIHIPYGQLVADKITDYQAFYERWRKHFVSTMEPKHMPEHWSLDRKVGV